MEFLIIGCLLSWLLIAWKKRWFPGFRHEVSRRMPKPELTDYWKERQHNEVDGRKCGQNPDDLIQVTSPVFPGETVATLCGHCLAQLPAEVWTGHMSRELAKFEAEQATQAERDAAKRQLEADRAALHAMSTEVLEAEAKLYAAQLTLLSWTHDGTKRQEITNKSLVVTKELDRRRREAKAASKEVEFDAGAIFIHVAPKFDSIAPQLRRQLATAGAAGMLKTITNAHPEVRGYSADVFQAWIEHNTDEIARLFNVPLPTVKQNPGNLDFLYRGYSACQELEWKQQCARRLPDSRWEADLTLGDPILANVTLTFNTEDSYVFWANS